MHTLKILYYYYYLLRIILLLMAVIWKLPLLQGGSKTIGGYYRYLLFIISEHISSFPLTPPFFASNA